MRFLARQSLHFVASRPMRTRPRRLFAFLLLFLACMPGDASCQGLSGGRVSGTIYSAESRVVAGANIELQNLATGATRRSLSNDAGRFEFEDVAVGTYRLRARTPGRRPVAADSVRINLGDQIAIVLTLGGAISALDTMQVVASVLRSTTSDGAASGISRALIERLPLLDRDFVLLFALSAQSTGAAALSISGQHARFNAIQIDGAVSNDLFGVNITPGSNAGGRAISLDALEEVRILTTPMDVRQGGFSGGLINAVTRSGTNRFRGSAFSSY